MKNKIALAAAFLAATSYSTAEIVINDFLSFEGFVDMSYTHTDMDNPEGNENSFAVDQVEVSWLFDFDPVTAQIDFTHLGSDSSRNLQGSHAGQPIGARGPVDIDNAGIEQAFATYHMDNGSAITAGLYASMLGFEAFEPTGLYQYSFAYDVDVLLPGYAQGVKYTYEQDNTFFGISVQDAGYDRGVGRLGGNQDPSSFAVEAAGSIAMDNGVSFFLGGIFEESDSAGADDIDSYVINSYVTFETGAWIFAGELNYGETDSDLYGLALGADPETEVLSALVMANFAYSEAASVTGRISYIDFDADSSNVSADDDWMKFTLAHGYAFTDNLFLVNEISYSEFDEAETETLSAAVELIFSF